MFGSRVRTLIRAWPIALALSSTSAHASTVYTASNTASGNALLAYSQTATGKLVPAGSFDTGGVGNGAVLVNQGGIALTGDRKFLVVVNAGSDTLTVFRVDGAKPVRTDIAASGGQYPVSVAVRGNVVYALNRNTDSIAGFTVTPAGKLSALPGSNARLGGSGVYGAQIGFTADGLGLIVTEFLVKQIAVFRVTASGQLVAKQGKPEAPQTIESAGTGPLGFAVAPDGTIVVSEAEGDAALKGTVSTYRLGATGLKTISAAVPARQSATCWVVISADSHFAYTTNTASGTVTEFTLGANGAVARVPSNGVSGRVPSGALPLDEALSPDGKYLFTVNYARAGITAFAVGANGILTAIGTFGTTQSASANGLVVR